MKQVQKRGKVKYTAAIVVKIYYSPECITRNGEVTSRFVARFVTHLIARIIANLRILNRAGRIILCIENYNEKSSRCFL